MVYSYGETHGSMLKLRQSVTTTSLMLLLNFVNLKCIVLDVEGTTTPISFVTDVLFPYARDSVGKHLSLTYGTQETIDDIKLLRAQVEDDLERGVPGAVQIPPDEAGKEDVVAALVANVEGMIKADRKITSLKQLQVRMLDSEHAKQRLFPTDSTNKIGRPPGKMDPGSFVLSKFNRKEREEIISAVGFLIHRGVEAVRILVYEGFEESATYVYNAKSLEQLS